MTTPKTAAITTARHAPAARRMLLAARVFLATVGLMTWVWFAVVQVGEGLRPMNGFEGRQLDD